MPIKALSSNCPIRRQQTTHGLHVDREDPLVLLLVDLAGGRELAHGSAGPQRLARSAAGRFELVPDAGDGGDVLVVERVDEVFLNRLLEGAGDGLGSVCPVEDIASAHRSLEAGGGSGKRVVRLT